MHGCFAKPINNAKQIPTTYNSCNRAYKLRVQRLVVSTSQKSQYFALNPALYQK